MISYENRYGYVSHLDVERIFTTREAAEEYDTKEALNLVGCSTSVSLMCAINSELNAARLATAILFLADKIRSGGLII